MNYYNNKQHPNYYYSIRTFVRFTFWGSVAIGLFGGAIALGEKMAYDPRPDCDVTTNRDFTWDNNTTTPVNLAECKHPYLIVLQDDGTWRWYDSYLDE
jgi:hypothetical protein